MHLIELCTCRRLPLHVRTRSGAHTWYSKVLTGKRRRYITVGGLTYEYEKISTTICSASRMSESPCQGAARGARAVCRGLASRQTNEEQSLGECEQGNTVMNCNDETKNIEDEMKLLLETGCCGAKGLGKQSG